MKEKMSMKMSGKILKKEPMKYKFALNFSKIFNQDNEINTRKIFNIFREIYYKGFSLIITVKLIFLHVKKMTKLRE